MDTPAYLKPGISKWLLILPIFDRLYTSVIVWNPENTALKVSWATDMSPRPYYTRGIDPCSQRAAMPGAGEGVPGVWGWVGGWRAIPVPRPHPPDTHI